MKKTFSQTTIISDPGIDDILSLLLYNKLSDSSKNTLITSFGNVPESSTFQNGKEVLGFFGDNWNIMRGANQPVSGTVERPWPYYFHGPDGVWNTHSGVDTSNVKLLNKIPALTGDIISLSPMTDLYLLSSKYKNKIKNITVMGGVFFEDGNETPYAETNIAFDPVAANLFFNLSFNCPVKIVPLDVTRKVFFTETDVESIPETVPENKWIKEILKQWFIKYSHEREENFNLHDPLAVYLHFFPEKAIWLKKNIHVILNGKKRGQTVITNNQNVFDIAVTLPDTNVIKKDIMRIVFDL